MKWLNEQGVLLGKFLTGKFRRTLGFCALGMLLTVLLGLGVGLLAPEQAAQTMNSFMEQVEQSGVVTDEGQMSVFALLMNNWRAMLISAAYGFVPFLFLPVISLVTNGVLLGMLAALFVFQGASSLPAFLAGILPHGVFELPALVFSVACGMHLCRNMGHLVTSRPDRTPLPAVLEDLLRVLVMVVAPLTVAAAFVECYVTPAVMELFL